MTGLEHTPLHHLHLELGARMAPFAGHALPLHYPSGVLREHLHTRSAASLFDVSHMGQIRLCGAGADAALEALMPADLTGLAPGRQRYGLLTDDAGGILDDLMVARAPDHLFLVVNAARRDADLAHLMATLPAPVRPEPVADAALLALQGPGACAALDAVLPGIAAMRFMDARGVAWEGTALFVSRSGYTGEDGFEIAVPAARAEPLARALLAQPGVAPAGLGARDSLRLEAGLCLHGQDIDTTTTPVEAGLGWAISPARRPRGARPGGFPGAARILSQLADGPARLRVGLLPEGRAPMRAGTPLYAGADMADGAAPLGQVTSGGFSPSLGRPVAMGYLPRALCAEGTRVYGEVRGRRLPVQVARLPFVPPRYRR